MRCVIAIAVVALGCSSKAGEPAVVPGAPAGDVTEEAGDVRATCDGATRALAVGDVVSGDDVIATGADGRVTIVLRGNHVPWSLGPGLSRKVSESAAWTAAAAASGEAATDDHSAAAGRHAERSATDTGASAPPPVQPPPPPDNRSGSGDTIGLGNLGTIGHGAGGGNGEGFGAGHGALGGGARAPAPKATSKVTTKGGPPVEVAQRIVRQNLGRVRLCYENGLAKNPALGGALTVQLAVAPDGSVAGVSTPSSTIADDGVVSCIARAMNGLAFPSSDHVWTATVVLTLSAGG